MSAIRSPVTSPSARLDPFGEVAILTHRQTRGRDFESRLRSVWPLLKRLSRTFLETLTDRERANCDVDDVLSALTLKLLAEDWRWKWRIGKYSGFAARLARNELHRMRNRVRTVETPLNTSERLREYHERVAQGRTLGRESVTFARLQGAARGGAGLESPERLADHSPAALDRDDDRVARTRAAVWAAVGQLDPLTAIVVGRYYGLDGEPARDVPEVARSLRMSAKRVREKLTGGCERLREALAQLAPDPGE